MANVLHINPWTICCPVGLVFFGFLMLFPGSRRTWTAEDNQNNTQQKF